MTYNFNPYSDYNTEFKLAVDEIIKRDIVDRQERITEIGSMIDSFVNSIGKRPQSAQISRLTHYILKEELKSTDPHKSSKEEYHFLSASQVMRRQNNETGMEFAENCVASDGKAYGDGKRRKRTKFENMVVDGDFKGMSVQDRIATPLG